MTLKAYLTKPAYKAFPYSLVVVKKRELWAHGGMNKINCRTGLVSLKQNP